jgi:hypothetical protein
MKDKKKILLIVLFVFLLIAFYLYRNSSILYKKQGDLADSDQKDKTTKIENYKDRLPDNFPADLPVYEQAEIVSASASDKSVSVMWKTIKSIEEVKNYYDSKLKDETWEYDVTIDDGVVMYKLNKDARSGFMVIAGENGFTTITVAIGLE